MGGGLNDFNANVSFSLVKVEVEAELGNINIEIILSYPITAPKQVVMQEKSPRSSPPK